MWRECELNSQNKILSKSNWSRIITEEIKIITDEIELLISKRKKIEENFEQLRKKLLIGKKTNVLNSLNWEDWKMLSIEYDEMKQIIDEIDKKWIVLKQIQTGHRKKHKIANRD
jgi:hypothetical protein